MFDDDGDVRTLGSTHLNQPFDTLLSLSVPIIQQEKTRIFKQLTEAYNILSNAERRRQYDSKMGISRVTSFYGVRWQVVLS